MRLGRTGTIWLALVSALMWGLWWAPVRGFEALGVGGLWANVGMTLGAAIAISAFARRGPALSSQAIIGAALIGAAVSLYGSALAFTDVVRAILLFYLAPAWSTAIECAFMGRRWTWRSAAALGLSFLGVAMIFRFEVSGTAWNWGDLAALVSGVSWSVGAAVLFTTRDASSAAVGLEARLARVCALSALAIAGLTVFIAAAPPPTALLASGLAVLGGAAYIGPILLFTMVAAVRLSPATMSFLLTAEILSGVASSALFLTEPFGAVEAAGAVCVALGALIETLAPPPPRPAAVSER
jgi:drug/metabolite transporter (DMT)-like permease